MSGVSPAPDGVSLEEQIACVARELRLRRRVYPRFVTDGRMTIEGSVRELRLMQAVLETLRALPGAPAPAQGGLALEQSSTEVGDG